MRPSLLDLRELASRLPRSWRRRVPKRLLYVSVSRAAFADYLLKEILPGTGFRATRDERAPASDPCLMLESNALDAASDAHQMANNLGERLRALVEVFAPGYLEPLDPRLAPSGSVVASLLKLAEQHGDVSEALALVSGGVPSWHAIYDVIEFLGDAPEIARRGWATKRQVNRHRQTANHYRHLGAPRKHRRPDPAPTIEEARTFVFGLLRRWLEEKRRARRV
jgi:hypothetical protein